MPIQCFYCHFEEYISLQWIERNMKYTVIHCSNSEMCIQCVSSEEGKGERERRGMLKSCIYKILLYNEKKTELVI